MQTLNFLNVHRIDKNEKYERTTNCIWQAGVLAV